MHLTTIDPAVKSLVLDRLLDAHPDLADEVQLLAAVESRSVDTPTVALQVERALMALPFTCIADRVGRRDGRYVDETEAGWSLLTDALRPFRRSAVRLGREGHVLAARQVAVGIIVGVHRACASGSSDVLCVWLGGEEVAHDLVEDLAFDLERVGVVLSEEDREAGFLATHPEEQRELEEAMRRIEEAIRTT
jgi:hypothetical protein